MYMPWATVRTAWTRFLNQTRMTGTNSRRRSMGETSTAIIESPTPPARWLDRRPSRARSVLAEYAAAPRLLREYAACAAPIGAEHPYNHAVARGMSHAPPHRKADERLRPFSRPRRHDVSRRGGRGRRAA